MSGGITKVTIPDPGLVYDYIIIGTGTASVTYSGVIFSTRASLSDGELLNVGFGVSGDPAVLSSQNQTTGVPNILTSLPGDVTGFALYYDTFDGSSVNFTLSNGQIITQGSSGNGYSALDFLGVTDTTPFNSVLVTSSGFGLNLNNVSYGQMAPEPATWLLLAGGLAAAALLRRRRVN
jgi:hypothetical protein